MDCDYVLQTLQERLVMILIPLTALKFIFDLQIQKNISVALVTHRCIFFIKEKVYFFCHYNTFQKMLHTAACTAAGSITS